MKRIVFIIIGLIGCLAVSCRRTAPEDAARLDLAEALVMTDADSAKLLLQGLDVGRFESADERARFVLTDAMARYRLDDYSADLDSLLTIAIDRFATKDDRHRLMQSLFLRANARYNERKFSEGMMDALKAYEVGQKDTSLYWRAKTSEQVSDFFAQTNNFKQSIPYSKVAIEYYSKSGHYINSLYATCDLAVAYDAVGLHVESLQLLDSVRYIAQDSLLDDSLMIYILENIYPIQARADDYKGAEESLLLIKSIDPTYEYSFGENALMANIMLHSNSPEKAKEFLNNCNTQNVSNFDKATYWNTYIDYYQSLGQYDKMIESIDSLWAVINQEVQFSLKNSAVSAQASYYKEQSLLEKSKKEHARLRFIIVILCLVIVLGALIAFLLVKVKRKNLIIEDRMAEVMSLTEELDKVTGESSDLRKNIWSLFKSQWKILNDISGRYFENPKDAVTKLNILNEYERQLKKLTGKRNVAKIIRSVDDVMNGILSRIKEEFPEIADDDLALIATDLAGFSPKTICLILDMDIKNFYSKRERLYGRIYGECSEKIREDLEILRK